MNRFRLIGIVVIAVVVGAGTLWLLWPTPQAATAAEATAGPYLVRLKGDPPKVGVNSLTVQIEGSASEIPTPDSVTFEPAMPQMGHATPPVVATAAADGEYRGDVDLSMPGQWEITVRIKNGPDSYDAVLSVTTKG